MSLIYSSLSNPGGDLQQLENEFEDLFNFFNSPKIKRKVDFQVAINASIDELTSFLIEHQHEIRLFHFSGHSNQSVLDFGEADFEAEHISRFFHAINESSRLDCIFLNGCENQEIVDRLSNVPVVIGTQTKVQDRVAKKVTLDFFTGLIAGKSTYEQAFNNAVAASNIPPSDIFITRGLGGRIRPAGNVELNQYFLRSNAGAEDKRFPFKPENIKWSMVILLFLVLAGGFLGWFFRDDISKSIYGYDCSCITTVEDKCNFVIADFATNTGHNDIHTWLFNNLSTAQSIQAHINPINLVTFAKAIKGTRISRDSLPALCHYDFNLTGSIDKEAEDRYRAEFNIFPYGTGIPSYKSVPYYVSSLGILDSLITNLSADKSNVFVLHEMCIACAMKKNLAGISDLLKSLADTYDPSGSSETYQLMLSNQADLQLEQGDTAMAIVTLDKIAKARNNNFATKAFETKLHLQSPMITYLDTIAINTELIRHLEDRQNDSMAINEADKKRIYDIRNEVTLERADVIARHKTSLSPSVQEIARRDYQELRRDHYRELNYNRRLRMLDGN